MPSSSASPVFSSANVAAAPPDALFGLVRDFKNDPSAQKVSLVIGAYRDNDNKPWLLPSVKKVISFYLSIYISIYI